MTFDLCLVKLSISSPVWSTNEPVAAEHVVSRGWRVHNSLLPRSGGKEAKSQKLTQMNEMREAFMLFSCLILADVGNEEKASWNRSRPDQAALVPTWRSGTSRGQRSLYWNLSWACKEYPAQHRFKDQTNTRRVTRLHARPRPFQDFLIPWGNPILLCAYDSAHLSVRIVYGVSWRIWLLLCRKEL